MQIINCAVQACEAVQAHIDNNLAHTHRRTVMMQRNVPIAITSSRSHRQTHSHAYANSGKPKILSENSQSAGECDVGIIYGFNSSSCYS